MQATIEQPGTGLSLAQLKRIMANREQQGITRPYVREQLVQALQDALKDRDEIDAEIANMRRYLERTR